MLAHADRYNPDNIDRLISAGALIQLNVDSMCKLFVPEHIKRWVQEERVVALGSDIHGSDKKAYKRFQKAVKRLSEKTDDIMSSCSDLLYHD